MSREAPSEEEKIEHDVAEPHIQIQANHFPDLGPDWCLGG